MISSLYFWSDSPNSLDSEHGLAHSLRSLISPEGVQVHLLLSLPEGTNACVRGPGNQQVAQKPVISSP